MLDLYQSLRFRKHPCSAVTGPIPIKFPQFYSVKLIPKGEKLPRPHFSDRNLNLNDCSGVTRLGTGDILNCDIYKLRCTEKANTLKHLWTSFILMSVPAHHKALFLMGFLQEMKTP